MKPIVNSGSAKTAERPCVLYVEDDEQNWEVAHLRLSSRYDLVWAKNDREMNDAIAKYGARIRVVLMDIQLKDSTLTGIELTRWLRGLPIDKTPAQTKPALGSDVPIIFVTAAGAQYTESFLLAQGGSEVITKPVDFTKLNLALARACLTKLSEIVTRNPQYTK